MKNSKKLPAKQLEKFSNIFTQLGLVLVLFIVFITLEHQTEQKTPVAKVFSTDNLVYDKFDEEIFFRKEVKPKPKIFVKPTILIIDTPIVKGDDNTKETIIDIIDKTPEKIDINTVEIIDKVDEQPIVEDVAFVNVQNAPIFKGCENLSKEENKRCFDKKMKQFVVRNFDIELANQIGLRSGNHKIRTQFVIDDKGEVVDVKIAAKHKALEEEANRIIKKLPQFKPGKQNNRSVKVKYYLPISFSIE